MKNDKKSYSKFSPLPIWRKSGFVLDEIDTVNIYPAKFTRKFLKIPSFYCRFKSP